jgi:DNA-binding XRE family transcriptional regulator
MKMRIVINFISKIRSGLQHNPERMTPKPPMEAPMNTVQSLSPDAVLQDLGDRLRQLRKSRQLRQFDMESLGLSYKYYQRLESGQVNPTLVTLHKLLKCCANQLSTPLPAAYHAAHQASDIR